MVRYDLHSVRVNSLGDTAYEVCSPNDSCAGPRLPEHRDPPKKNAPGSPSVPRILDTCKSRPEAGTDTNR
ncbi:hypothetical protein CCR75_001097 [Bremia lactucae]|uniref:Uncharacterized protein n=1 Tax=Bremia lactucae TaxID=4779 RepID=A0A976FSU4_BRELC|nr:hypothetical protein CCR75_001097 [Bremia lactucae]